MAVEDELAAIRKLMPHVDTQSTGGIVIYRGKIGGREVALTKSGMGSQRAYRAARSLVQLAEPSEIVIGGFCAGLRADIVPGDLILASSIFEAGTSGQTNRVRAMLNVASSGVHAVLRPDQTMLERSDVALTGLRHHKGATLTVPKVIALASEKQDVAKSAPVIAIDMESFGAATACQALVVPWVCVRAVTDALDDDLPIDFSPFTGPGGEVSRMRIALHIASHPNLIRPMASLGKRSAKAAKNLANFVTKFAET